jgi:hypothetical protein
MRVQTWPMDLRERAFYEATKWVDAVYGGNILIVDIDFKTFSLSVNGEDSDAADFADKVRHVFFSACTKLTNEEHHRYA